MLRRQMTFYTAPVTVGFKVFSHGHDIDFLPDDEEVPINIELCEITVLGNTTNFLRELTPEEVEMIIQDIDTSFRGRHHG